MQNLRSYLLPVAVLALFTGCADSPTLLGPEGTLQSHTSVDASFQTTTDDTGATTTTTNEGESEEGTTSEGERSGSGATLGSGN